jgi:hypothetical protein
VDINDLLYEFFGIDSKKAEFERRMLLSDCRDEAEVIADGQVVTIGTIREDPKPRKMTTEEIITHMENAHNDFNVSNSTWAWNKALKNTNCEVCKRYVTENSPTSEGLQ